MMTSTLLVVLLAQSLLAQSTQHVVIAVVDGARYSETFGDPAHQYIPRIWSTLRPLGTIYTSFRNNGVTETNPGHSSILTGTWQTIANDGTEKPHMPTLFEYARKGKGTPASDNFVILGKTKLDILASSDNPEYGSAYGASVAYSNSQYDDRVSFSNFKDAVTMNHPRLLIVNLPKTDNAAHTGSWSAYIAGLRNADSLVYAMWEVVNNDPIMAGKTTMFVTNDHGRHDDQHGGFTNHGDGCEGCRHIMLLVVGPDTPGNGVDSAIRQQIDIAPTIGQLLGVATPYAAGTALVSAFTTGLSSPGQHLPEDVTLLQNYPNPFNPSTTISYRLPRTSPVSIAVYNALGQAVKTLVDREQPAGVHDVAFDGSGLSSGVYFYRLQAGRTVRTRAMLLAK